MKWGFVGVEENGEIGGGIARVIDVVSGEVES